MSVRVRQSRIVFLLLLFASSLSGACIAEPVTDEVDQKQVVALIEQRDAPLLLDVRSADEYASGHIPGAVNIPHDRLKLRAHEIARSRDEEIIVYCERGGRARKAGAILEAEGFSKIRHLTGDMSAWRNAKLPTE